MSCNAQVAGNSTHSGRESVLIVDDSTEYLAKEPAIRAYLSSLIEPRFYYTNYENRLIRIFHGTPIIGNLLSHLLFWFVSLYAALDIFVRRRNDKNKLFINPIVGLFYCFLARVARRDERIGLAGFLFVQKQSTVYLALRKWFAGYCCSKASIIVVYSRSEVAEYSRMFPRLVPKFRFVHYGRDFDIFGVRAFESLHPYIASGGVSNRDFGTLAKALWILREEECAVHCKIATRTGQLDVGPIPPNLEMLYNVRLDQFGDFLQRARLIVLPLKRTEVSGGHMVLLEAMSRGKLVVVAGTPGVRDYVDASSAILYKAEDPADLARAIRFVLEHYDDEELQALAREGLKMYRHNYTHVHLLERLVRQLVCQKVTESN
jgi:glycosyltransferase involved in cell wall biosynthesis